MGVGTPLDLLEAVHRGVDMFDCIMPSVLAQQGVAFTSRGRLNLYRGVYKLAEEPVDADCACATCAGYSRAYLHHLIKAERAARLAAARRSTTCASTTTSWPRCGEHILADTFAAYPRRAARTSSARRRRQPVGRRRRGAAAVATSARSSASRSATRRSGYASIVAPRVGRDHARRSRSGRRGERALRRAVATASRGCASRPPRRSSCGTSASARRTTRWRRSARARARRRRSQRPLHLVSFEHDLASLRLALRHAGAVPAPAPPGARAAPALRRVALGDVRRSSWTLLEGDFRSQLTDGTAARLHLLRPVLGEDRRRRCGRSTASSACSPPAPSTTPSFHLLGVDRRSARRCWRPASSSPRGAPTGRKPETTLAMTPAAALHAGARGRVVLGPDGSTAGGGATPGSRATFRRRPQGVDRARRGTAQFREPAVLFG